MTAVTPAQMAGALKAAGFTGTDIVTGVAIGLAESGGRADVTHRNSNGSTDYGTWQINSVHPDALSLGNWANVNDNARMAKLVFDQAGHSWRPWSTFTSGSYQKYTGQAMTAAGNPSNAPGTVSTTPVGNPVSGAFDGIIAFFKFITDAHNWLRLGEFAVGVVLLLVALYELSGIDAGKVATTALKVGAVAA